MSNRKKKYPHMGKPLLGTKYESCGDNGSIVRTAISTYIYNRSFVRGIKTEVNGKGYR